MRAVCYSLVFLILGTLCSGRAVPNDMRPIDPAIRITKVVLSGSISIEISNSGKEPLKLWEDSNRWGAARWRVLRIRSGQIEVFFQNPSRIFTVNVPTVTEIPVGAHIEHTLDLNGGNWCGFGHCASYNEHGFGGKKASFEPNDTIIVVYDVPPTKEAQDMGVWRGVAAAFKTIE